MKVAVVGGCASGKSTIVAELCCLGYEAYVVGQEHSVVSGLWARRSPDALVYLDVTLEAVRSRRDPNWPAWLFRQQQERLCEARKHASVRVNTARLTIEETVALVDAQLSAEL